MWKNIYNKKIYKNICNIIEKLKIIMWKDAPKGITFPFFATVEEEQNYLNKVSNFSLSKTVSNFSRLIGGNDI